MKRVDPPVPEVKLRRWWCNCRSVWCWLDQPEPVEWTDPLNPHGDGTLRPGDPVFDALMRGEAVVGNFDEEKGWEIETHRVKEPDPSRSPIERNGGPVA